MAITGSPEKIDILFSAKMDMDDVLKKNKELAKELDKTQKNENKQLERLVRLEENYHQGKSRAYGNRVKQQNAAYEIAKKDLAVSREKVALLEHEAKLYSINKKAIMENSSLMGRLSGAQSKLNSQLISESSLKVADRQLRMQKRIKAVYDSTNGSLSKLSIAKRRDINIGLRAQALKQRDYDLVRKINRQIQAQTDFLNGNTRAKKNNSKASGTMGTGTGNSTVGNKPRPGFWDTMFGRMEVDNKMENVGSTFGHKTATTLQYATAGTAIYAVAAAAREGVTAVLDFDLAVRTMSAVLGISLDSATELGNGLNDLSEEFGGAQKDIQGVALSLGRAGVAEDKLIESTKVVLQMARLTGDSFDKSANAIISFTQVFGQTASISELGDKLAYVANVSRLSTQDIGTFANYALAAAKNVGLTVDAVGGLSAAFSNAGVNASTIGTQIRRFTTLLTDQSKSVQNFFVGMGVNQSNLLLDLQQGGEASNQALLSFIQTLQDLDQTTFTELTGQMDILASNSLQLMRNNKANITEFVSDLQNGVEGQLKSVDVILDSYKVSWEKFWNSVKSTFIEGSTSVLSSVVDDLDDKIAKKKRELYFIQEGPSYLVDSSKEHVAQLKADLAQLEVVKKIKQIQTDRIALNKEYNTGLLSITNYTYRTAWLKEKELKLTRELSGDVASISRSTKEKLQNEKDRLLVLEKISKKENLSKDYLRYLNAEISKAKSTIQELQGKLFVMPKYVPGFDVESLLKRAKQKIQGGEVLTDADLEPIAEAASRVFEKVDIAVSNSITSIKTKYKDLANISTIDDLNKALQDVISTNKDLPKESVAYQESAKKAEYLKNTIIAVNKQRNIEKDLIADITEVVKKSDAAAQKREDQDERRRIRKSNELIKQLKLQQRIDNTVSQIENKGVSDLTLRQQKYQIAIKIGTELAKEKRYREATLAVVLAQLDVQKATTKEKMQEIEYSIKLRKLQEKDYRGIGRTRPQEMYSLKNSIGDIDTRLGVDGITEKERNDLTAERTDLVNQLTEAQLRYNNSISYGAVSALDEYRIKADDTYGQIKDFTASALSGMEDQLTSFVTTGKASWAEFADAILEDLARIAVRMTVMKTMTTLFGSPFEDGGAFSGGTQMFAKGGAFTNNVYNKPTPFAMGGVSLGVMGEAGPEAIMPLTRTSDGSLGVRTEGSGNSKQSVTVQIKNESGEKLQVSDSSIEQDMSGMIINVVIDAVQTNKGGLRTALSGGR